MEQNDEGLFDEASEELTENVKQQISKLESELPHSEEVWEVKSENTLGVLNTLLNITNVEEYINSYKKIRKKFIFGKKAGVFEQVSDVENRLDEIEKIIINLDELNENISQITPKIPQIKQQMEKVEQNDKRNRMDDENKKDDESNEIDGEDDGEDVDVLPL